MYKDYPTGQCLICGKTTDGDLYHFIHSSPICVTCINSFEIVNISFKVQGYKMTILYQYNEFFQKLLYQYKGLYDLALKDAFLSQWNLKKYRHHLVVIAPSSVKDNEKRGFNPNLMIVRTFSQNIFTGIYKRDAYKQTDQKDRTLISKHLLIKNGELIKNKRILLFDDVTTSLSTIKTCIELINQYQPKSIEILVLASNQLANITALND